MNWDGLICSQTNLAAWYVYVQLFFLLRMGLRRCANESGSSKSGWEKRVKKDGDAEPKTRNSGHYVSLLHAPARAQKQLFQIRPSNVAFHTHFNPDIPPCIPFLIYLQWNSPLRYFCASKKKIAVYVRQSSAYYGPWYVSHKRKEKKK
jgi:hypothetical protein